MKKPLNVFYKKAHVGLLTKKSDDTLSFKYSREWLDGKESFYLSPALPLQEEEFNNRFTKSYFDNLLPEGDTLKNFEKILKKSFEDPYQLLESYGLDCAGALEVTPFESPPDEKQREDLEKISYDEIDEVINRKESLYIHSLTQHKGRFSLAGAQDKIPVVMKGDEVYIPMDSTPTTHILKPPNRLQGVLNSVQNEYLCMRLAKMCGLKVPAVHLVGKENLLFVVQRYDRKKVDNKIERIHQFDLCQAQGYPSAEKYEEDGGPDFSQNYKTIENISDKKVADLELSLQWLAFNLILGNNDSHSKNLSFLCQDGEVVLAPLYDLLSTSIYTNLSGEFAFSIGGQRVWNKVKRKNLEILAQNLGFSKRQDIFIDVLKKMMIAVEEQYDKLSLELKSEDAFKQILKSFAAETRSRLNFFKQMLK